MSAGHRLVCSDKVQNTSEGVDASQAVHELGTDGEKVLPAGAPAQVGVVRDECEGVRAARHLLGGTVGHSTH